jgi:hypothetical protein
MPGCRHSKISESDGSRGTPDVKATATEFAYSTQAAAAGTMETAETTEVAAGATEAAAGARESKLHVEGNANNGRASPYRLAGALCRIGNSYVVRGPNVDIPYNAAVPSTFSTEVLRAR